MTSSALALTEVEPLLELLEAEFQASRLSSSLRLCEPIALGIWERALLGPARDILSRPGKEFRKNLVSFAWYLSGGTSPMPVVLSLLVEILHAGSLVIDDIEDGSPSRRGRPSLHTIYGVPTALNTGNWLYFWPSALLARLGLSPDDELAVHRTINSTLMQCHYGQALDLRVKIGELAQREVAAVVRTSTSLKTGSLLGLATRLGARAAGAPASLEDALGDFGCDLGLGLQMLDDLGGLVSQRSRHKGHEDLRLGRLTWPWAWLAEHLDHLTFQKLKSVAVEVEKRNEHPEVLAVLMRKGLGSRGVEAVRTHLAAAHAGLARVVGPSPRLTELRGEIDRMEASYVA
jgi:geranylgeranyl pyrophosphate synthase